MKHKNYHIVRTIPKSNIKTVEREAKFIPLTKIYDRSPTLLGTGTSMKSAWLN